MRLFRVDEANELLPTVTVLVGAMLDARRTAAIASLELQTSRAQYGESGTRHATLVNDVAQARDRILEVVAEIQRLGCAVKDVDLGLVDFPSLRGDELINLCWKLGEPSIGFWHRMDEGFAWRKPIDRE